MTALTLGIDIACRAAHQAALARDGTVVWRGRKFTTNSAELDALWSDLDLEDPAELTVVVEPTRNAWIVVAQWFRARGAKVVMVPTTQSADLRRYYSRHAKNDRLDSEILAKLPLLHPEGLREFTGAGAADPLRRLTKQRSSIVKRRTAVYARLDALVELLGPAWYAVLGTTYGNTTLTFLARYADPHAVIKLGGPRLTRFLVRHSHGRMGEHTAQALLDAARETLALWGSDRLDFAELAGDISVEAEQALFLTKQISDLDERIANLYTDADPQHIVASAPGIGPVTAAIIAGRIGNPHRFTSLAAIRAYSGLVPKTSQSGLAERTGGITKAGDPLLREALYIAADHARRTDPQLAAKYARLMATDRHRNSVLCHLAADLLTRIAACMRNGNPYRLCDVDGREITATEGRDIITERHPPAKRRAPTDKGGPGSQKSPSAPTSRPATTTIRATGAA